jgi:acetyltransferase
MAESGAFDILVAQADLSQFRDETNDDWCELTLRTLAAVRDRTGVLVAGTTVHNADPPRKFQELARELGLPLLRGPRDAMLALGRVARLRPLSVAAPAGAVPDLADLLTTEGALPEHDSALVLERFGVPFAPRRRAATPADAARAAEELGPPVVVKLDGPAHKSRSGGVVLGLRSPHDAAEAARRLGGSVLVAKQAEGDREVFCGLTRDADYGPVLAVGEGGAAVEDLGRVLLSVPPLSLDLARELVADSGIVDVADVVASTLVALGRLAQAYPEVESVDVNPLVLGAAGAVAVDALVVVGPRSRED